MKYVWETSDIQPGTMVVRAFVNNVRRNYRIVFMPRGLGLMLENTWNVIEAVDTVEQMAEQLTKFGATLATDPTTNPAPLPRR